MTPNDHGNLEAAAPTTRNLCRREQQVLPIWLAKFQCVPDKCHFSLELLDQQRKLQTSSDSQLNKSHEGARRRADGCGGSLPMMCLFMRRALL